MKTNKKIMAHWVSNPNSLVTKTRAEQSNTDTTRPQCRRYQKCYNLYSTSEPDKLVSLKQR